MKSSYRTLLSTLVHATLERDDKAARQAFSAYLNEKTQDILKLTDKPEDDIEGEDTDLDPEADPDDEVEYDEDGNPIEKSEDDLDASADDGECDDGECDPESEELPRPKARNRM
jgi:hypothetical protein